MNIETMLRQDFAALTARLAGDDFAAQSLKKIEGVDRLRLVAVGGAGVAGAAVAASQFAALAGAIAEKIPANAAGQILAGGVSFNAGLSPILAAALLVALVGGATALVAPGGR